MTYKLGIQHETTREVELLPHEVNDRKDLVMRLLSNKSAVEADKRDAMTLFNQRIKGIDGQITVARIAVENGKEERTLLVVWKNAGDRAQLVPVGEPERILEQRPLEGDEKQLDIDGLIKSAGNSTESRADSTEEDEAGGDYPPPDVYDVEGNPCETEVTP